MCGKLDLRVKVLLSQAGHLQMHLGYKADTTLWICLQLLWSCPPEQDQMAATSPDLPPEQVSHDRGDTAVAGYSSQSCCDFAKSFQTKQSTQKQDQDYLYLTQEMGSQCSGIIVPMERQPVKIQLLHR